MSLSGGGASSARTRHRRDTGSLGLCLLHGAAHVTGVDVNSTMVDLAKVALREHDPSGRRFTVRLVKPGKSQLGDARFDMLVSEILGTLTTSESMFKYLAIYKDQYAPRPPECQPCRGRPSLACPPPSRRQSARFAPPRHPPPARALRATDAPARACPPVALASTRSARTARECTRCPARHQYFAIRAFSRPISAPPPPRSTWSTCATLRAGVPTNEGGSPASTRRCTGRRR